MGAAGKKRVILLVEDEALIALSEKRALEKYGYEVSVAASGEEAIEAAFGNAALDLVLMDINLGPGLDGTQVAERILRDREIPIIFVSSHSERGIVEKTERITSYGYVLKSSSITVLDASIKMAFKLFDANRALKESEEKFRILSERSGEGIYIMKDAIFTYVNPRFGAIFGYSPGELTDKLGPKGLIRIEDFGLVMDRYEKMLEGDREQYLTSCRGVRKDGSAIDIEVSGNVFVYQDQRAVMGTVKDVTQSKRVQRALEKSEKLYRSILDASPDGIAILDAAGNIAMYSQRLLSMFGYAEGQDLRGHFIGEFISPEDLNKAISNFSRRMGGTERSLSEYRGLKKDGSIVDIEVNGAIIKNEDDDASEMVIIVRDISQRVLTELALRKSEDGYRRLFEDAGIGIAYFSPEGRIISINRSAARDLGEDPDALAGKSIFELFPRPIVDTYFDHIRQALLSDMVNINEDYVDLPTGRKYLLGIFKKMRDPDGRVSGVQVILKDLSAHKDLESRLSAENGLLRAITTHARDAIILMDGQGLVRYWNPAAENIFGYAPHEALGRNAHDFLAPERYKARYESALARFLASGQGSAVGTITEMEAFVKTGEEISIEMALSGVKTPDGWFSVGIIRDITKRKQVEAMLQGLLERQELMMKEVHHRIKNNMNTIQSLLDLQAGTLDDSSAVLALREASSRVGSMMVLYDKLYRSPDIDSVSVGEYLPSLIEEIYSNFPDSRTTEIRIEVEDISLGPAKLQPLGIIINELLTNVMKYAFKGRPKGSIEVLAALRGRLVHLEIRDDGVGMPEDIDFSKSTGFGMTLIYYLTKQLNGDIRIERGKGTSIVLEFAN